MENENSYFIKTDYTFILDTKEAYLFFQRYAYGIGILLLDRWKVFLMQSIILDSNDLVKSARWRIYLENLPLLL